MGCHYSDHVMEHYEAEDGAASISGSLPVVGSSHFLILVKGRHLGETDSHVRMGGSEVAIVICRVSIPRLFRMQ